MSTKVTTPKPTTQNKQPKKKKKKTPQKKTQQKKKKNTTTNKKKQAQDAESPFNWEANNNYRKARTTRRGESLSRRENLGAITKGNSVGECSLKCGRQNWKGTGERGGAVPREGWRT